MFRRNPELGTPRRLKAKSLDDLSSSISSSLPLAPPSPSCPISTITHPAYHPANAKPASQCTRRQPPLSLTLSDTCHSSTSSLDQDSPLSPTPLPSFSLNSTFDNNLFTQSVLNTPTEGFESLSTSHYTFPSSCSTVLAHSKENAPPPTLWDSMVASTPTSHPEVHSPISQAMIRASIPQVPDPRNI